MLTNLQNALAGEIPNLDAFTTPAEAQAMRQSFKDLIPVIQNLTSYCEAKQYAMQARLEGKIEIAQRFEDAGQQVYQRLPEWARW